MLLLNLIILSAVLTVREAAAAPGSLAKVFNYQGFMPIKDDRTGEIIRSDSNETISTIKPEIDILEAEAACWKMINEQSVVTFALQNKVLDELEADLKKESIDKELVAAIEKISNRMRENMKAAIDALERDAADEYFDSLFEASEDIIYLSILLREPKLEDNIFLTLVKAVSRLGRNNSSLIQEFMDMCSFVSRSPKPRFSKLS